MRGKFNDEGRRRYDRYQVPIILCKITHLYYAGFFIVELCSRILSLGIVQAGLALLSLNRIVQYYCHLGFRCSLYSLRLALGKLLCQQGQVPCHIKRTSVVRVLVPPWRSCGVLMRMSQSTTKRVSDLLERMTFSSCISLR